MSLAEGRTTTAQGGASRQAAGPYSIGSELWPGISKLVEECGEVQQVAGKLIGAEGDENHWDGTNLRDRLQEELGDLSASISFVAEYNNLDKQYIRDRSEAKYQRFCEWHGQGYKGAVRPTDAPLPTPTASREQRLAGLLRATAHHLHNMRNHFVGKSTEFLDDWLDHKMREAGLEDLITDQERSPETDPSRMSMSQLRQEVTGRGLLVENSSFEYQSRAPGVMVTPEWFGSIPLQQQSVLGLAARGPDGVLKAHPCKDVVRAYRGCVLKAAWYGRCLEWGEAADGFMSMDVIADECAWTRAVQAYFAAVDELPHHYHLHLLHGAQILGVHHPDERISSRWNEFYLRGCEDAHMNPETPEQMNQRLGDWGRAHWS